MDINTALGQILAHAIAPYLPSLQEAAVTWSAATARSEDGRLTLSIDIAELPAAEVDEA